MSPATGYSREEILRHLQEFARDCGRPPRTNEPGIEEIVKAARTEFGSWKYALRIAGLQTYKAWRRTRTLASEIRRLLNLNPMTLREIRQELVKSPVFASKQKGVSSMGIFAVFRQSSNIKSTGPRRKQIYYLEGQETLAQTRLDAIMSEIPPLEEEIFYHLRRPMTHAEIEKLVFGDKPTVHPSDKVRSYLRELEFAGLIYRARFVGGRVQGRVRRFTCYELFGDLAAKTFFCRFDCPNEVAQLVAENVHYKESLDKDARISLASSRSQHLKRILPKNVCLIVDNKLEHFDDWK